MASMLATMVVGLGSTFPVAAAPAAQVATPTIASDKLDYSAGSTVTLTGAVKQFVAQANHAELHFVLLAPDRKGFAKTADGKYVEWGVEMAGAAAVAQQGITAQSFPVGTVFSVKLNPLRDGSNFGSRIGAIAKCPTDAATNKPKLPEADKHCDAVAGNTLLGGNAF